MTIAACFLKEHHSPVFLTDVLITAKDHGEFIGNLRKWHNQVSSPTINHKEIMHMRKTRIINDKYCVAWAGNVEDALEAVRNLEEIIKYYQKDHIDEQIGRFFDGLSEDGTFSLILAAYSIENNYANCAWWTSGALEYDKAGVQAYIAGSGSKLLENNGTVFKIKKDLKAPLDFALSTLLTCLGSEVMDPEFKKYRLGAYYELTLWEDGSWKNIKMPINLIEISDNEGDKDITYLSHSRVFYNEIYPACLNIDHNFLNERKFKDVMSSFLFDPFVNDEPKRVKVNLWDVFREPSDFEITLAFEDGRPPYGTIHRYSMLDFSPKPKNRLHDFLNIDFRRKFNIL